jgi:hypothetical protein
LTNTLSLLITIGIILSGQIVSAQDMRRYRAYALESTIELVVTASGAPAADVKTLHVRPATIQELNWRAPYLGADDTAADPVREIAFRFYDNALYQLIVSYDRARTEGLTNADILESIAATYGQPTLVSEGARTSPALSASGEQLVLARWETAESLVTLVRGSYTPEFQLILISKALSTRAASAIREAVRMDAAEAPARESAQRTKDAGDASAAEDKTRLTNKATFRP